MVSRFLFPCVTILLSLVATVSAVPQYAAADHVIILQCVPDQLEFNKYIYWENINGINNAVTLYRSSHPGAPASALEDYMGKLYVWMRIIPDYAHCLRDMGVDPSSVSQISPDAANVLIGDADNLLGFSPTFLEEVPIPGYTNTAYFPAKPIPITHEPPLLPDCKDKSFPSVNWSFCNFAGSDLSDSYLLDANLTGTNLSGSNLYKAYAFGATLGSANLKNADLRHAELAAANLGRADLAGAKMEFASLDYGDLRSVDLSGASLAQTHGLFPIFYNATLRGADLSNSRYVRADFEGADLSGANLTDAVLRGADFNGTNLSGTILTGTILAGANLHCIGSPVCVH